MYVEGAWRGAIDHAVPSSVTVGGGTALVVSGWLYHEDDAIARMRIQVGPSTVDVDAHSVPRVDVYRAAGGPAGPRTAYASGFWSIVPIPPVPEQLTVPVVVHAVTASGVAHEWPIARTTLQTRADGVVPSSSPGSTVICMTTHNPRLDLFERQVESIRAQSDASWRCIVSDDQSDAAVFAQVREIVGSDPRFEVHQTEARLGFYFNFEAVLRRVPRDATYVALADQDDRWAADKLATLRRALERDGAVLAYSDQRVVTTDGTVLAPTFWASRTNYSTGLRRMLAGNTVTGAASMFRRDLLEGALPFPPMLRTSYHDHWLAVVALATGRIVYVDDVLSDYVQHGDQVLGHDAGTEARQVSGGSGSRRAQAPLVRRAEDGYVNRVLLQRLFAVVLLLRFGDRLPPGQRRALQRVSTAERSLSGVLEFVEQAVRERPGETLGHHRQSALGVAWALGWRLRRPARARSWLRRPTTDVHRGIHPPPDLVRYATDGRIEP
jgi:hypothetical protein